MKLMPVFSLNCWADNRARRSAAILTVFLGFLSLAACTTRDFSITSESQATAVLDGQEQVGTIPFLTSQPSATLTAPSPIASAAVRSNTPTSIEPPTPRATYIPCATQRPTLSLMPVATTPVFSPRLHVAVSEVRDWDQMDGPGEEHREPNAVLRFFQDSDPEPSFTLADDAASYLFPTWSPDGKWLAYVRKHESEAMSIHLLDSAYRSESRLTRDFRFGQLNTWVDYLTIRSWSPDGLWLAFDYVSLTDSAYSGWDSTTYIVSRETDEMRLVGHDITALAWSPTEPGNLVFSVTPVSGAYRASVYSASIDSLDSPDCLLCRKTELDEKRICSIAWNPVDGRIALAAAEHFCDCNRYSELWVSQPAGGDWQIEMTVPHARDVEWSRDGSWLAGYDSQKLVVYDTRVWSLANAIEVGGRCTRTWMSWTEQGSLLFSSPTDHCFRLSALPSASDEPFVLWEPATYGLGDSMCGLPAWDASE